MLLEEKTMTTNNLKTQKEIVFIDFNKIKKVPNPTKEDKDNALFKKKYSVEERRKGRSRFLSIMKEAGY